ncbi:hypothetical protein [Winogradskyella psychrotolerans]|uniref:hypothetical protein n=1 Tax=Winogradskyella psychrotolerans TaxID=1344585 RepID=UPI001C06B8B4|nr:hypothetical protein [Winogradskyella psychrotolerans]MBU2929492.1 hypothetical protein [Winogradskyella psychrotolerans]
MTIIFLFVVSQQAVVIMHFKLNQQAIIKEFCININKPELHCNGKCHLSKELQKTEQSDSEKIMTTKNFDLAFDSHPEFELEPSNVINDKIKLRYVEFHHQEPYLDISVPPPMLAPDFKHTYY